MKSASDGDRLLRPLRVQGLYGIAPSTLRSWAESGKLQVAQRTKGGHRRYRESDVVSLLAELRAVA